MSHLTRLISILTLLKSKRLLTATELSKKFDVSVRTIYRDIRKLEDSGVPIITIEGKGYSILDSYVISPVQFTEKEANALITAQHFINQSNDTSLIENFDDAMTKIKSVFRSSIQEKTELLSQNIYVFNKKDASISSSILSEIQMAITNQQIIEVNYQKLNETSISFRKIEPCAMFSSQQKWILIGWCHLRNDYRAFRIDRIKHFKLTETNFENRNFNLREYYLAKPMPAKSNQ